MTSACFVNVPEPLHAARPRSKLSPFAPIASQVLANKPSLPPKVTAVSRSQKCGYRVNTSPTPSVELVAGYLVVRLQRQGPNHEDPLGTSHSPRPRLHVCAHFKKVQPAGKRKRHLSRALLLVRRQEVLWQGNVGKLQFEREQLRLAVKVSDSNPVFIHKLINLIHLYSHCQTFNYNFTIIHQQIQNNLIVFIINFIPRFISHLKYLCLRDSCEVEVHQSIVCQTEVLT